MSLETIRIGVVGLGRAFTMMRATFAADPRVRLVAACDPRPEARELFTQENPASTAFANIDSLCDEPSIELVYIASPHGFHAEQAIKALRAGKHVMVEKPMALTLVQCDAMIAAAKESERCLIVGHSHSFDLPILRTRSLIKSGRFGAVKMIHSMNYTDFLYRPRRPEELVTAQGGGAVFNQAAHQVDIVRLLADSPVTQVRAYTGNWDQTRNTEGAYSALLSFESGAFASITYSGYSLYDSDEQMQWVGETGLKKSAEAAFQTRKSMAAVTPAMEQEKKTARSYGVAAVDNISLNNGQTNDLRSHEHFGPLVVSCETADLRPNTREVKVFHAGSIESVHLSPPAVPRQEVIDEIVQCVRFNNVPLHSGSFARGTLAVCLAILESSRTNKEIYL